MEGQGRFDSTIETSFFILPGDFPFTPKKSRQYQKSTIESDYRVVGMPI
jgi:molybdopterin-guanine dinucleotide biosynthesis protein A